MLAGGRNVPVMISQANDGNSLVVKGEICGISCLLTIDTGASRTVISSRLLKHLTRDHLVRPRHLQLQTATGQYISVQGEREVALKIGENKYWHKVIVANIVDDCIIGLDFMKKYDCKIDLKVGVLKFGVDEIPIQGGVSGNVYCTRRTILQPRSQVLVPVKLPNHTGQRFHRCVVVEKLDADKPWITARTMVTTASTAFVRILNPSDTECVLSKGALVGSCEEISWLRSCRESEESVKPGPGVDIEMLLNDSRNNLTKEEFLKARSLLLRYGNVFSAHDNDIGRTGVVQHEIDTGESMPIRQRPRRIPVAREKEVEGMIEEMRRSGVIEPSISPWCSPVVLVKKKDGTLRFCIDYRRLNDVTKKDSYPLPRIDDTLDTLNGMKWFSTLDLKSGYWQVEIKDKDKEKTAFSTGKGLWQFNVMPFGLCNAPATFERLMEQILAGLLGETCLVYLDDIIIVGKDFDDHLNKLEQVLAKLREANLKLSPKKCSLFKRKVNYLGHVISKDGIQTDPEKISAVKDWPTPRDKTAVRAFLGLCSYYRRFVKNFSDVAKPLHQLTEEKRPFDWNEQCESSFNDLKGRLCETPILGYPDPEEDFIVDTDASNTGIGGILSQKKGDNEVVIAYFSKSLSKPERNYCVTRRELLAVVKTLQHFSKYLLGRKFRIRTDHAALKWLLEFKNPEGQVARWIEQLQEYDFIIEHRSGKSHGNADALSRRPCADDCKHCLRQEGKECVRMLRTDTVSDEWSDEIMQQAQQEDPDVKPIFEWISTGVPKPRWCDVAPMSAVTKSYWAQWDSLVMHNGVLCRKWESPNGKDAHLQVIVPKKMVSEVLRSFHDGTSGGHLGVKKTLIKIRQRFYWIYCREDVENWCKKCTNCASVKGPHTRSRGTLKLYNVGAPWERIALDVAGPFPASDSGNKYILVVMDYFTKWPEVFAIPNQEAVTIAEKLVNEVFCRFGVPLEIHSDQGRNFESAVFQETCRIMGLHKTRTTAYHPQSDGMVERFNQTLERHLAKVVERHQKDWDRHIPLFLMSYRSATHESTAVTPAYANFGRELRLPADLLTGRPPDTPRFITEYANDLRDRIDDVHQLVREHGLQASIKMKTRYDRKSYQVGFEEGSLVWLHNPMRRVGKSPKLSPNWEGPYKVVTKINDVTYRIQRNPRSPSKIVHVDRLARYHGNNDARDEHV